MASSPVCADRVRETTVTTGTGTVTLAGAVSGYQSFAAVGDGKSCYYCIADQAGTNWEVGIGTYTASGTTLSRDAVLASSNAGAAVTFGAGTKDVFVTFPAEIALPSVDQCDGRLTLTSGTPVTTADVTGATTIYFSPYKGNRIALWNGSGWQVVSFAEVSVALGTLVSATNYDVFAFLSSGALAIEIGPAWTNDTTRATALTTQDGVLVKSGAATRRYLGTFRTTATTTTEDSGSSLTGSTPPRRYVWNYYNRVRRTMLRADPVASYTLSSATLRQADANAGNQLNFLVGWAESFAEVRGFALVTTAAAFTSFTLGYDSTSANDAAATEAYGQSAGTVVLHTILPRVIALGFHFVALLEETGGSVTVFGNNAGVAMNRLGLTCTWES